MAPDNIRRARAKLAGTLQRLGDELAELSRILQPEKRIVSKAQSQVGRAPALIQTTRENPGGPISRFALPEPELHRVSWTSRPPLVLFIDLTAQEARYRGHLLYLPPLAFQLLALLASRPRRLVTKDEIYEHLWPEGQAKTEDERPYERQIADHKRQILRRLRALVQHDRRLSPKKVEGLIQTSPRRGYLLALFPREVLVIKPQPPHVLPSFSAPSR